MLHDYGEFNTFVDHVLAIMEDQINDEPNNVEQKDKEGYENTKTTRSELDLFSLDYILFLLADHENILDGFIYF